jgi:hypothetical protein
MVSDDHRNARHGPPRVVRVAFSSPDEFLHELLARGPNVEPVLRTTLRWQRDSDGAPLHHLSVVATYLRRIACDVVAVTELQHYVGPVWSRLDDPASERCRASAQALLAVLESASRDLGVARAPGVYHAQPDQPTGAGGGCAPKAASSGPGPAGSGRDDAGDA